MVTAKSVELAHAYLVAGSAEMLLAVSSFLKKAGIETERNPDVYVREYLSFGIDDARELRERANARAIAGDRRVFIVVTPSMTSDAQNALLKTLEEPPADAVFFFIVASPSALLGTLRSRSEHLSLPSEKATGDARQARMLSLESSEGESAVDVKKFLAATREMRIEMIKPLYVREDDEERDIRGAVGFLVALEDVLAKKVHDGEWQQGIHAIYRARKYLMDKGALLKPLLEQVALLVPRT